MKAFDAQPHLLDLEAAPVDFAAIVQCAPDQRLADPCLAAGHVLVRPGAAFDQVEIDVAVMPVGIEVGARPARGEQRNAGSAGGQVQLVDETVFTVAEVELGDSGIEVSRELGSRMRRVEHERRRRSAGAVQDDGCGVERHGRTQIGLRNKSLAGRLAVRS